MNVAFPTATNISAALDAVFDTWAWGSGGGVWYRRGLRYDSCFQETCLLEVSTQQSGLTPKLNGSR